MVSRVVGFFSKQKMFFLQNKFMPTLVLMVFGFFKGFNGTNMELINVFQSHIVSSE